MGTAARRSFSLVVAVLGALGACADSTPVARGGNLCPGWTAPDPGARTCRSDGDCPGGECVLPGARPFVPCGTDPGPCSCSAGLVCIREGCAQRCVPPCTKDSCGGGQVCGENGLCRAPNCLEGFTCPKGFICDSSPIGSSYPTRCRPINCATEGDCGPNTRCLDGPQGRGEFLCRGIPCADDGDCDCGICLNGGCVPSVYVCSDVPP